MKPFDVLDPEQDVDVPRLLEASAGTGKTFTIEHLYARLLKEKKPPTEVSRLLVVTFTKAATRELKDRIRKRLDSSLKEALLAFDEAKIFTLHGFCFDALRAYPIEADFALGEEEAGNLPQEEKDQLVKDFFRTGLKGFSLGQLDVVLRYVYGDTDELVRLLLKEVFRSSEIVPPRSFDELTKELSCPLFPSGQELLEVAKRYRGLAKRQGELKRDVVENITSFASDLHTLGGGVLDRWIREGNVFLEKVVLGELKAKQERGPIETQLEAMAHLLKEAKNPLCILAKMAVQVKEMLGAHLARSERTTFDGILEAMERATRQKAFCERVRAAYDVAIVDEFQDTDPLQWTILQRLFGDKTLILVGDPKQSIYAFRNADIYAYLEALDTLKERASLDTNYRSRPGLVAVLNALFSPQLVDDPIPLPERKGAILCPPVKAGVAEDNPLSKEGAVQFFVAKGRSSARGRFPTEVMELESFLPFIGKEIQKLSQTQPYSHFAILVHDRYQAKRVCEHLKGWGIPATSVRGSDPASLSLFWPLYHVVCAALNPEDGIAVRSALASPLIGLHPDQWTEQAFLSIGHLSGILKEKGFFPFFEALMNTEWEGKTSCVRLLERGEEEVDKLYALAERFTDAQEEDLVRLFHKQGDGSDERFTLRTLQDHNAVQVLTTFASKGLEFGVVFALALASRSGGVGRGLIPHRKGGKTYVSGDGGSDAEKERMREELDAEKMRLFYVALTRAKDRVYVPCALDSAPRVPFGSASPVELYLAKLGPNQEKLYSTLPIENVKRLDRLKGVGVVVREIDQGITPTKLTSRHTKPLPLKPAQVHTPTPRSLQSFSGLAMSGLAPLTVEVGEERDFQSLPAGAETGILVHELLEKIDPKTPREQLAVLVKAIARGRLVGWEGVLSEMVWSAFHSPPLKGVSPSKMVREMDLLYEVKKETIHNHELDPGLMAGILDLFFEDQGKFYLLDWKSNRLPAYDLATLTSDMERHDYFFQAKLYAEAANRYLTKVGADPLSGFYYVFLRGLAAGQGGVLFLEPEELKWS